MHPRTHALSLAQWREIDSLCDAFEASWQRQQPAEIDSYLGQCPEWSQSVLLPELLRIEVEWRLARGEAVSSEDYATRFPRSDMDARDLVLKAQRAVADRTLASTTHSRDTFAPTPAPLPATDEIRTFTEQKPSRQPSAEPTVRQLGEYDLLELLGTGGMGEVWKARHRRLNKLVALKLIRSEGRHSAEAVSRFVREMKAIGDLDHENIVEASDAGEAQGVVYLVMKLIDGQDLGKYVKRKGPLPVGEACNIAYQVALGLQYLHERRLVHRDLKPGNLMRTSQGKIKILDLGLARWQADSTGDVNEYTQMGQGMGTPDYMAPEQIAHAATVDIRADLYGLGGTLFYLLTGQPPFAHIHGSFEKMKAHEKEKPADVRILRPEVPAEVARLVTQLLAKRPDNRPTSPAEVAQRLAPFVTEAVDSVTEPLPVPVDQHHRQRRRRWPVLVGSFAALLLLGLTLALSAYLNRNQREQRFQSGDERIKPVDDPKPARALGPLRVVRFDVRHTERMGASEGRDKGLLGVNSYSTCFGDQVRVAVTLSQPAYGYLLAYSADGKQHLLSPQEEDKPPVESDRLAYPSENSGPVYEVNDGVGLHVFLAVISTDPLPSYAQWQKSHGTAPWKASESCEEGVVWRQTDSKLEDLRQQLFLADRGPNVAPLGVKPMEQLLQWWQTQKGIQAVGLVGFAVKANP